MENHSIPGGMISPTQPVQATKPVSETDEVSRRATEIATQQLQQEAHLPFTVEPVIDDSVQNDSDQSTADGIPQADLTTEQIQPTASEINTAPEVSQEQPVQEPIATLEPPVQEEPQPSVPVEPVQPIAPAFITHAAANDASNTPVKGAKKRKLALLIPVIVGLFVLGGGGAAAYMGYMVPNKPENKLISALTDFVEQTQVKTEGVVDYTPADAGTGVSFTYKTAADTVKKHLSVTGTVGVKGTQFPYEMRYLDKNIYFKVGGLNSLPSVLPPVTTRSYTSYLDIVKKINDQWYVVDSSYLQSLGAKTSCITDVSLVLTDEDKNSLKAAYTKHPLFTIKSSTSEKIDGMDTTKYIVDPTSDNEAKAFVGELKNMSIMKKIKDCGGSVMDTDKATEKITNVDKNAEGTLAINVTNDKKLKKIEIYTKEKTASTKMTAVFTYGDVNVSKPEGAKPVQDLIGGLFGESTTQFKR